MDLTLFRNFRLLDPHIADEIVDGYELLVEGDRIKELSAKPIKAAKARIVDCGKRTLMPGLIDCHVHVIATMVNIGQNALLPDATVAYRAARIMKEMLDRGFTTVRDTGGADWGIKTAVESGLIPGPRLFISGRAIGPTGGHSDSRRRTDQGAPCGCCNAMVYLREQVDGPDEMRRAVETERQLLEATPAQADDRAKQLLLDARTALQTADFDRALSLATKASDAAEDAEELGDAAVFAGRAAFPRFKG